MTQRLVDAWYIQFGACNPSGVARALVKAIDECRAENPDTANVRADVACRMICHQLAHLFNLAEYDLHPAVYSRDYEKVVHAYQEFIEARRKSQDAGEPE